MSGLLPGATWVQNARSAGGTYVDGHPWRICLHTIEGALGTLSASLPASHPFPPHLWVDPSTRKLYQTVPLDRSAFALYQGDGPYTNKARALQVEIAGYAATAGQWPDSYLANLAADVVVPLCRWVESQGSRINLDNVPPIGAISGSASTTAPQRLSYSAWEQLDGLCSHRHVPDNDHWDSGTMNIPRLVELAKELLGTTTGPASSTRRRPVSVPATLRPGTQWCYDLELIAEGEQVPNQAGTGPKVVASTLVVRQLAVDGVKANVVIVWGSGKAQAGRTIGGTGEVERYPCPYTGLASVVSDRPLAVRGETYTA